MPAHGVCGLRWLLIEFRKYFRRQLLVLHQAPQSGDEVELVIGDLLLGNAEFLSCVFVRPAADEEQLSTLELGPFPPLAPAVDLVAEGFGDRFLLQILPLAAAGDA